MIEFDKVCLSYDEKTIFKDVSFRVKPFEKVIISGKSGIGKSSLLHLLLGFKTPSSGSIQYENKVISPELIPIIRKKTAYIPQGVFIGRGKVITAMEEIFSLKVNRGLAFDNERCKEVLDFLELPSAILQKKLEMLSGGEKQRIAIAIAILLQRDMFLLDEITSSLDKHLKQKITHFFLHKQDATALLISHDMIENVPENARIYDLESKEWKQ